MTCYSARRQVSGYIDGAVRNEQAAALMAHLERCEVCARFLEQIDETRSHLRRTPSIAPPRALKTRLRIMASREQQTQEQHHGSRVRVFWEKWKFRIDELMRPLTIPATGGLLSSLILFALFGLTIESSVQSATYEVPVFYSEHMDANLVPVELRSAVVLNIALDTKGRILDYSVRDGSASFTGDASRLQYNNISMPEFPTVLALARPISSDISISLTPLVFRQ